MNNYYNDANIRIKKIANYDKIIRSFSINREEKYVEISYMNGKKATFPLSEVDVEELEMIQTQQLEEMKKKIYPKLNRNIAATGSLVTISGTAIIANLIIGNPFLALGCLLSTTSTLLNVKSYSLKREMNLISWINDHKEEANEVIREEVLSIVEEENLEKDSNNPRIIKYPRYETRYSEEMYYDGINLSNMGSLGLKELRQLKRKVKQKTKQLKK